jgi:CubicO group peptidase (beta-lactamase class C family)
VLTFTGGFPLAPMHPRLWEDREGRVARMAGWWLNWEPGSRYEYHPTTAHWVLVEIIMRRTGLDFRDYIPLRLTQPMGVPELFVGMPEAFHHRAADVEYAGFVDAPDAAGGAGGSAETRLGSNRTEQRRAGSPGSGGWGGAGELALFYQRLVSVEESAGYTPLRPETIEMATRVHTQPHHVDEGSGLPANRGLSVVVAGDHPSERGFGAHASPRAFGHSGAGGQVAWGDPETGLSVGFLTNGFAPNDRIRERSRAIGTLAAECLL